MIALESAETVTPQLHALNVPPEVLQKIQKRRPVADLKSILLYHDSANMALNFLEGTSIQIDRPSVLQFTHYTMRLLSVLYNDKKNFAQSNFEFLKVLSSPTNST